MFRRHSRYLSGSKMPSGHVQILALSLATASASKKRNIGLMWGPAKLPGSASAPSTCSEKEHGSGKLGLLGSLDEV